MNKIVFPALLVATIMVAGAFAFMPVEQASTVHLSGTVIANQLGDATTGLDITAEGVITDANDATVNIGEQLTITAGDASGTNAFTGLFVDVVDTDGAGADGIASQIVLRTETETAGTDAPVTWIIGTATDATAATIDSSVILQTAVNSVATTALTLVADDATIADDLTVTGLTTATGGTLTGTGNANTVSYVEIVSAVAIATAADLTITESDVSQTATIAISINASGGADTGTITCGVSDITNDNSGFKISCDGAVDAAATLNYVLFK